MLRVASRIRNNVGVALTGYAGVLPASIAGVAKLVLVPK